ncbi:hypothetical protein CCACVL1_13569 [Corchorus capsularis]|uniref:Uncharacterized protein n=1 Tax=Corchorus capsularis TaxID=210143 RepID=A0A1R3IAF1_COCAP|nr:hypothetical protein CCACVL1_13569 [Corchorus capsularis]
MVWDKNTYRHEHRNVRARGFTVVFVEEEEVKNFPKRFCRKPENNDSTKTESVSNDQTEPIAAFSRPPPQPPLLGPLVALSLLETLSHRDGDDN